jgi:hypothetical protein
MSRLASIRPVRTAVISPNLGARASSPVYSDYMMRPSHKGFSVTSGASAPAGVAVRGYADVISSSAAPAPVHIRPVNPEAGIFELVPKQTDAKGFYEGVFLGYPDTSSNNLGNPAAGMPTQSLGAAGLGAGPVTKLAFALGWDWVDLEADWKFSTVMSVVPNSPNDNRRLYKVEVTANELGEPDALGPPVEVRVYPGVTSARFAWLDSEADTIVPRIRGETEGWPSQFVNRRAVEEVAKASALRVYEVFRDRPWGSMMVDAEAAGPLEPVGMIDRVSSIMDGGATRTRIDFGLVRQPADIWRYLDGTTRRALLRSQLALADPLASTVGLL